MRRWTPGASPICASPSHGMSCLMPLEKLWPTRASAARSRSHRGDGRAARGLCQGLGNEQCIYTHSAHHQAADTISAEIQGCWTAFGSSKPSSPWSAIDEGALVHPEEGVGRPLRGSRRGILAWLPVIQPRPRRFERDARPAEISDRLRTTYPCGNREENTDQRNQNAHRTLSRSLRVRPSSTV